MKTHQMLSVHILSERFKNATIAGHFGLVFEENSVKGNHMIIEKQSLRKTSFSKCFQSSVNTETKCRFEERFRKAPFSWRISV